MDAVFFTSPVVKRLLEILKHTSLLTICVCVMTCVSFGYNSAISFLISGCHTPANIAFEIVKNEFSQRLWDYLLMQNVKQQESETVVLPSFLKNSYKRMFVIILLEMWKQYNLTVGLYLEHSCSI